MTDDIKTGVVLKWDERELITTTPKGTSYKVFWDGEQNEVLVRHAAQHIPKTHLPMEVRSVNLGWRYIIVHVPSP